METISKQNTMYLLTLLRQIKQTHNILSPHQPIIRTKLTKSDKIKFACDYYDAMGPISLLTILKGLTKEDKQLQREIIEFIIRNGLLKPYPSSQFEYRKRISDESINDQKIKRLSIAGIQQEYNHQNWLEIYDENTLFEETKAKHPTYKIYPDQNGNPIKFDKNRAIQVKLAIMDNGIIPARCIVEGAYPYVAKNEFSKYIKHLKTLKGDK